MAMIVLKLDFSVKDCIFTCDEFLSLQKPKKKGRGETDEAEGRMPSRCLLLLLLPLPWQHLQATA